MEYSIQAPHPHWTPKTATGIDWGYFSGYWLHVHIHCELRVDTELDLARQISIYNYYAVTYSLQRLIPTAPAPSYLLNSQVTLLAHIGFVVKT